MGLIHLVMGAQFGSEGKGEVCNWLASMVPLDMVIRVASPNSGHTFTAGKHKYVVRQLPSTWKAVDVPIYIPSGSVINVALLRSELSLLRSEGYRSPITVSPYVTVVDPNDVGVSECLTGTTRQGVGEARSKRCLRRAKMFGFEYAEGLASISYLLDNPESNILIESSQGFGLSTHSKFYPFCTSTDIMPYQILQDSDIPYNRHKVLVWAVIRTFPIRIAGNSGPLGFETTWDEIGVEPEITTVTQEVRRVGNFNPYTVRDMLRRCSPDFKVLSFVDYVDEDVVKRIEHSIGAEVDFVSVGPGNIIRRELWATARTS